MFQTAETMIALVHLVFISDVLGSPTHSVISLDQSTVHHVYYLTNMDE